VNLAEDLRSERRRPGGWFAGSQPAQEQSWIAPTYPSAPVQQTTRRVPITSSPDRQIAR